jgi:hypothetical protein
MKKTSPEVDAYIAKAAPFAQPILKKLRLLFHKAAPQIEETVKWGVPHFEYKGIVGGMAAFKQHVRFGFWKGNLLADPEKLFTGMGNTDMSAMRITTLADLPSNKVLIAYIREAVDLNEREVKPQRTKPAKNKNNRPIEVPDYFAAALKKNKQARATFEAFSPSHKREYVEWLTEARQEATREKRLATALEWLAEGKPKNWKYMKGNG